MPSLKHKFHSPKGPGTDTTFVRPTDWNAEHDLKTVATTPVWLGQNTVGGASDQLVREFPVVTSGVGDDMTMYTKAQVDAAITAAVGAITIGDTGDLCGSLRAAKTGWVLLNGQTIGNVGSAATFANASAEDLFTLMWNINGGSWPILDATTNLPSRGASAAADWLSIAPYKKLALPDARGCVIGMLDLGAGVNFLIAQLATKVGFSGSQLTLPMIPPHAHAGIPTSLDPGGSLNGGSGNYVATTVSGNASTTSVGGQHGTSSAASVAGNVLTVGGVISGVFGVGQTVVGTAPLVIPAGAVIIQQLTGPAGGAGTYLLNIPAPGPSGPGVATADGVLPVAVTQPTMGANIFIKL